MRRWLRGNGKQQFREVPPIDKRNGKNKSKALNPERFRLLTAKQQLFVQELFVDLCVTEAAIRAGCSPQTASEWLKDPVVASYLHEELENRLAAMKITSARVVRELANIAFFNIKNLLDESNKPITQLADLPDEVASAIDKLEVVYGRSGKPLKVRIIPHNKLKALEVLAKMLQLLKEEEKVIINNENLTVMDWDGLAKKSEEVNEIEGLLQSKIQNMKVIEDGNSSGN